MDTNAKEIAVLDPCIREPVNLRTAAEIEAERKEQKAIVFWYRNYKGEEGYRRVIPISMRFGTSEWHKEPQWLLLADDTVNGKQREFAMRDISSVVGKPEIAVSIVRI